MNRFVLTLATMCLWTRVLADEKPPKEGGAAPLMVSFTNEVDRASREEGDAICGALR